MKNNNIKQKKSQDHMKENNDRKKEKIENFLK